MRRIAPTLRLRQFTWICGIAALPLGALRAQDTFELRDYGWSAPPRWAFTTYVNAIERGTRDFVGTVAPTHGQRQLTFELDRGLTSELQLGGYLLYAARPGRGFEVAGFRFRSTAGVPASLRLPFRAAVSAELGFPRAPYDANELTLELRPIIERRFGRLTLDLNPVFDRALKGPAAGHGWAVGMNAGAYYRATHRVELGAEYVSGTDKLRTAADGTPSVRLLAPAIEYVLGGVASLNVGYAFGLTRQEDRGIARVRLTFASGTRQGK